MLICDLCNQPKPCLQKDIDGREYDLCHDCWNSLAEELKGKGRAKKDRETVFLPSQEREDPARTPLPGEPPKIWSATSAPQ
jgi:hypothetical protein